MAILAGAVLGGAIGGTALGWSVGTVVGGALLGGALGGVVENMIPEIPSVDYSKLPTSQSPTYSNKIRQNQARVGGAIPHILGTVKFYPDIVNQPYREFGGNLDYAYNILSLGKGDLDPASIELFVGNSPIGNFKGIHYKVMPPGGDDTQAAYYVNVGSEQLPSLKAIRHSVFELEGITGAELVKDANNDGIYGEYLFAPAVVAGSANFIVNLLFPRGLYDLSAGNPVAGAITMHYKVVIYHSDQTQTTYLDSDVYMQGAANTDAIYANFGQSPVLAVGDVVGITISRLTDNKTTGGVNECRLGGLWLDTNRPMDNAIWRIPMRITANAELAKSAETKIMVKATNPNALTVRQSVEYIWQKAGLSLTDIDAGPLDSAAVTQINGILDVQSGIDDTLKKITAIARARPVRDIAGKVTFVVDQARAVDDVFDDSNIVEDSLKVSLRFIQETDNDGIKVRWFDADLMVEKFATHPQNAVNPKQVDLFGCTNGDVALAHAVYVYNKMQYQNKTISWQTEMKGNTLSVGNVVTVADSYRGIAETVIVTGISPGGDRVNVTGVNYDERVYA